MRLTDGLMVNPVSTPIVNQDDDDAIISMTSQVSAHDAINVFVPAMQQAEENGALYNEIYS